MKRFSLVSILIFGLLTQIIPATANGEIQLRTAAERIGGYDRKLFKHWIDADKNGCDTRKEVLITEAIVKPKKGPKCVLTGGRWISVYDGKTFTKDKGLDVDHIVPLAEAWRSGAWAWTPKQRQDFANDLSDPRALIAVSASSNRSKGDQDVKTWLPAKNKCTYIQAWVAIKTRYSLTVDAGELTVIQSYLSSCSITDISVEVLVEYETIAEEATPAPVPTVSATPAPVATTTTLPIVSPGAFCSPAGAVGRSSSGVTYTCKTSPTDTRNRWRQ